MNTNTEGTCTIADIARELGVSTDYLLTGKPGTLTKEIVIKEPKPRKKDFNLSENFLQYKREIISHLEG